ncbi:LysR family transcriptional regulator [Magnetovibrio sp. PR-2]|uniref:LysR family transcriptional regulator n=1 Tax=Magnetovibrio sp. PR-2 TaxID=3120356 RepID=UPI002FCE062C
MNANSKILLTRDIDVALLRAFIAVAENGSMTVAAKRLNVTQGAVSQRIKRLEELLDKPLFNRTGARLYLTPDGEMLSQPAQKLVAMNDEVFALMTAPQFSGVVRFGVPYDIVFPFIGPILKSFSGAYPNVNVELFLDPSDELKKALARGDLDLTLTTETHTPPGAELLVRDALVWTGGIGGTAHMRDPVPLITINETCMFRAPMRRALEAAGKSWKDHSATRNMDATLAMLSADLGITALLESTMPPTVQVLGTDEGMPELPEFFINLYTSASETNTAAAELAKHIRDQFAAWRRAQVPSHNNYKKQYAVSGL